MMLPKADDVIYTTFRGQPVVLNKTMPIDKGGWGEGDEDSIFAVLVTEENDNAATKAE